VVLYQLSYDPIQWDENLRARPLFVKVFLVAITSRERQIRGLEFSRVLFMMGPYPGSTSENDSRFAHPLACCGLPAGG
jgi:hypothetical protein